MNIDMTQVFVSLISVITLILTGIVVPWIKTKTTAQQQDNIKTWAKIAVYAAQQLFSDINYDEKKEYAVQYVSDMLKKYHINLTEDEISTYIESALKEIKLSVDNKSNW